MSYPSHRKRPSSLTRSASLLITATSLGASLLLLIQVLTSWNSLKFVVGESGYAYERGENDVLLAGWGKSWRADGVRLIWGLLASYFATATAFCAVGLAGVIKNKPSLVRLYRSYEIASIVFMGLTTILLGHIAIFGSTSSIWSSLSSLSDSNANGLASAMCDELSRQPELMRSIIELGMGLVSLENCESWLEWALIAVVIVMTATLLIRIHFLVAISHYHGHLVRYEQQRLPINSHSLNTFSPSHNRKPSSSRRSSRKSSSVERTIFLLPQASPSSPSAQTSKADEYFTEEPSQDDFLVYAPVPLSTLPPHVVRDIRSRARGVIIVDEHRRHHRNHSGLSLGPGEGVAGRISLPVGDGALGL